MFLFTSDYFDCQIEELENEKNKTMNINDGLKKPMIVEQIDSTINN